MARVRHSMELGSRDARKRLSARSEPYWQVIERGLSLGYRKSSEGGAWIVRRYDPGLRRHLEGRIATTDDHRDADGTEVLSFSQAQRKALEAAKHDAEAASGKLYTVADAAADYLDYLRTHKKSAADTEIKLQAYVLPRLGQKRVADLKPVDFDAWLKWALKRQPRRKAATARPKSKRQPKGRQVEPEPVKDKNSLDAKELVRRRKATVNRVIAMLKACLNYAYSQQKVARCDAWSRLKKFRAVDSARLRWLTEEESLRLLNACRPDFRPLVQAGLLTGCREGELLALQARDYDASSATLLIHESKSGKPRRVPLTGEGVSLFESLTAGRDPGATLFSRANGLPWHRVAVIRAMQEACAGARIEPPATFYTLRHTYASHLVQAGTPLLFVASALGHRDARMVEKHYGHFAPSHVADTIRANLPSFGIDIESTKVAPLGRKRKTRSAV